MERGCAEMFFFGKRKKEAYESNDDRQDQAILGDISGMPLGHLFRAENIDLMLIPETMTGYMSGWDSYTDEQLVRLLAYNLTVIEREPEKEEPDFYMVGSQLEKRDLTEYELYAFWRAAEAGKKEYVWHTAMCALQMAMQYDPQTPLGRKKRPLVMASIRWSQRRVPNCSLQELELDSQFDKDMMLQRLREKMAMWM